MKDWSHTHFEMVSPGRTLALKLERDWIFDGEERLPAPGDPVARIQIGDFTEFGRGLVIDGTVQLTETIDALYTTSLVFPAALAARRRARWLVLGGGDGATPREALRFRDAESVRLVDISRVVIERTQELIPSFWDGCQRDPRLALEVRDAWDALRETAARDERVDVLVYDLSDPGNAETNPFTESAADRLYSAEAFRLAARCLGQDGVFVAQMAELSGVRSDDHFRAREALARVFRHVYSYRTHVEPFGYSESFIVASNREDGWDPSRGDRVEATLAEVYTHDWRSAYSGRWHEHLFTLPPSLDARQR